MSKLRFLFLSLCLANCPIAFAQPHEPSQLSDARIKENIVDIPDSSALSAIIGLRPRLYNFIESPPPGGTQAGFIAQEFFTSFPQYTFTNGVPPTGDLGPSDTPWSIYKEGILPYLPGAIKGLKTIVDTKPTQTIGSEVDCGTLTWTGGAPSGTITKRCRLTTTGKVAIIDFIVRASVAGLLTSGLSFALPTGYPAPATLSNVVANSLASPGTGGLVGGVNLSLLGGQASLFRGADSSGQPTFQVQVTNGIGLGASGAQGQIQYITN